MQIEALYDHGLLKLPEHIRLKHQRFKVRLEIPDQEVVASAEDATPKTRPEPERAGVRARIDNILGPYKQQMKPEGHPSRDDDRRLWREHLEEKHLDRR